MNISKEGLRKSLRAKRINAVNRTRKILLWLPVILLIAGVLGGVFSGIRIFQIRDSQNSQIAAERWAGDSGVKYRQLSLFAQGQPQIAGGPDLYMNTDVSLNLSEVESIRKKIDTKVMTSLGMDEEETTGNSDIPENPDEGEHLWIDAYSAQAKCTIERKKSDTNLTLMKDVTLTGVGGDFFLIHPMPIESGAFLSDDTPDTKKIVLDTELAFYLFGTFNVVGERVFIAAREYSIVGVVRHPSSDTDTKTQGEYVRAYVLFPELSNLISTGDNSEINQEVSDSFFEEGSGTNAANLDRLAITCYEAILPDQVSDIAKQNLLTAIEDSGKQDDGFLLVENTGRFSFLRLWDAVFPIGETEYNRRGYTFPFWESSARMAETESSFWWVILLMSVGTAAFSGLAIYARFAKKKFSEQIQDVDGSFTTQRDDGVS